MKNRVRVATNKARRFLFNSGELQKNKEKVNEMDYFIYFCKVKNEYTSSNPQLSSSVSFLRLNVLSSLN